MSDLISRQDAINAVYTSNGTGTALKALKALQSERPTVNTARHGHWIFRPFPDEWIGSLYICSECRDVCCWRYRFCPSCGAKMDGGGRAE